MDILLRKKNCLNSYNIRPCESIHKKAGLTNSRIKKKKEKRRNNLYNIELKLKVRELLKKMIVRKAWKWIKKKKKRKGS